MPVRRGPTCFQVGQTVEMSLPFQEMSVHFGIGGGNCGANVALLVSRTGLKVAISPTSHFSVFETLAVSVLKQLHTAARPPAWISEGRREEA